MWFERNFYRVYLSEGFAFVVIFKYLMSKQEPKEDKVEVIVITSKSNPFLYPTEFGVYMAFKRAKRR